MKVGDIVKVGLGDNYYLAVITEIDEDEEMVRVKDLSQIEDNIQPMRCVRKATVDDMVDELRSIYGYFDTKEDPVLCGFVFRNGKELNAWQVEVSKEDEREIWSILGKYETEGCSVVDASDERLGDLF